MGVNKQTLNAQKQCSVPSNGTVQSQPKEAANPGSPEHLTVVVALGRFVLNALKLWRNAGIEHNDAEIVARRDDNVEMVEVDDGLVLIKGMCGQLSLLIEMLML